jgi:hypothetical protein
MIGHSPPDAKADQRIVKRAAVVIAGRGEHDQVSGNALTMPD